MKEVAVLVGQSVKLLRGASVQVNTLCLVT